MYSRDSLEDKSNNDKERLYYSQGFNPSPKEQDLKVISPNKNFRKKQDYFVLTFNLRFLTQARYKGSWINQFISSIFQEENNQAIEENEQENQNDKTPGKMPQLRAKFHKWIPMYSVMQWLNKELAQHLEQEYLSEQSLWISLIDDSQNYRHINLGSNLSQVAKKPFFNGNIEVLSYQAF